MDDLRLLHWQDEMRMVMIDVKEFYMSGEAGFLSRACSELFCDVTGVPTASCKTGGWPDLTYKVIIGSGLELLHSGEVSDAGFWIAADRWLLNTSVRRWCSLTY